jgi:hypothetical protein
MEEEPIFRVLQGNSNILVSFSYKLIELELG